MGALSNSNDITLNYGGNDPFPEQDINPSLKVSPYDLHMKKQILPILSSFERLTLAVMKVPIRAATSPPPPNSYTETGSDL